MSTIQLNFFLKKIMLKTKMMSSLKLTTFYNKRMGKTRDLLKKIRAIKGPLHAKMGTIKERNGMDLREAEDIKKRW